MGVGQPRFTVVLALIHGIEQTGEEIGDMIAAQIHPSVEPGLRVHRRNVRCRVDVGGCGQRAVTGERCELFGVPLLHHSEAAELALRAVEVTVVVGVAGDEAVAADVVVGLDPLDDMYGEGQPGDPGFAVALVLQIELR